MENISYKKMIHAHAYYQEIYLAYEKFEVIRMARNMNATKISIINDSVGR